MTHRYPMWARRLDAAFRYKWLYGGRGSAKSETVASKILERMSQRKMRWLCAREFQKSIRESVHATLVDMIERMGMQRAFRWTEKTLAGVNGSEFIFEGLHANASSIKSMHKLDGVWVEEAETVSRESWKYLIPTVRADGSEIWATFNPRDEEDATWELTRRLMKRSDALVLNVNWRHNPFFPQVLKDEMANDFAADRDLAMHVWEGEFRLNKDAQIFAGHYKVEAFEPQDTWDGPWYGLDFGFATDPLSAHEYWAKGNTLYVRREAWGHKVELNDIAALLKRQMPRIKMGHELRCDNARPEAISHLRGNPFNMNAVPAEKWPGSVEDGILYLKSLGGIVIHPDCKEAEREAKYYSYAVDKNTGKVLNKVVDRYNHFWDDCRYAMQPAIRTYEREITMTHTAGLTMAQTLDEDLGLEPVGESLTF